MRERERAFFAMSLWDTLFNVALMLLLLRQMVQGQASESEFPETNLTDATLDHVDGNATLDGSPTLT